MNLQDRAFAVGIFVIMGICCIGAYVAVSGFMNASPSGLGLGLGLGDTTPSPVVQPSLAVAAGTIEVATPTPFPSVTAAPPTNTPKGFKPSPTPVSRGTPSPSFLSDIPTAVPVTPGTPSTSATQPATAVAPVSSTCGYKYCPKINGAPDDRAPTGKPCPPSYLWGFVLNSDGKGAPGVQVRFTTPEGESDRTFTKAPPDPAGRWDVTAGSGMYTIQILDQNNKQLSPAVQIRAGVTDPSGATCPTRLDFVQP